MFRQSLRNVKQRKEDDARSSALFRSNNSNPRHLSCSAWAIACLLVPACLYLPALSPLFLSYEKFKWQPGLRRLNNSISNSALCCQQCLQTISCIVSISKDRGEECEGISFFQFFVYWTVLDIPQACWSKWWSDFIVPIYVYCLYSITNLFPMTRRFIICGTTGIFLKDSIEFLCHK